MALSAAAFDGVGVGEGACTNAVGSEDGSGPEGMSSLRESRMACRTISASLLRVGASRMSIRPSALGIPTIGSIAIASIYSATCAGLFSGLLFDSSFDLSSLMIMERRSSTKVISVFFRRGKTLKMILE